VRQFAQRWRDYDKLEDDYEALSVENQQLSLQLQSAQEAIRENERLQAALDAKSRYEALDPIFARVMAREPGQWFETFSINRGNADGVAACMAVVNGSGLIGRVYEAGMNYAKVICIIDSRSAVACMVQSTRDNGIMRGRVAATSNDAECFVYYLPNLNSIMPGDSVITSGTDSLFPKGLHIGSVTAVSMDAGSEGSYAVVTPSVDFRHLEEVFVLREVIETDSDENLPAMGRSAQTGGATATPAPNATPTPSPTPAEETWSYPSAGATPEILETLPEDEWARGN
jgi:rod shape-determining protein MreC